MQIRCSTIIAGLMLMTLMAAASDLDDALEASRDLIAKRQFKTVIEILENFDSEENSAETKYILNAEIGRCYFHLGEYEKADQRFTAAVHIHPERVETALYLEATSYLLGKTPQALSIFSELLASGARDLYLAVTLPGERQFLGETEVWRLMDEHAIPLEISLADGSALGVSLGDLRASVISRLGAGQEHLQDPALSAQAGPRPIWAFSFGDNGELTDIFFHSEYLLRYTPYRLQIGSDLDWRTTPAAATSVLGPPNRTETEGSTSLSMQWEFKDHSVVLSFGPALEPSHPGHPDMAAMLKTVHLSASR